MSAMGKVFDTKKKTQTATDILNQPHLYQTSLWYEDQV